KAGGLIRSVEPERAADETNDDGADDAEKDRHDDAAGIAPWHHKLGQRADDETEKDPPQNAHDFPPHSISGASSAAAEVKVRRPFARSWRPAAYFRRGSKRRAWRLLRVTMRNVMARTESRR